MDLDALRAFVVAVEERSVTGAARRLYRSQSAVTRQIQALEHEMGGPLLDRRSRPLLPTALGKTVLDYAGRTLAAIGQLKAASAAAGAEPAGELRVGMALTLADLLPRLRLDRVARRFPRLHLALTADWSPQLLAAVRHASLDLAVLVLPDDWLPPNALDARRLAPAPFVVIAPRTAHLPRQVDLATLGQLRWVVNPEGCPFRAMLRDTLARAGQPLNVAIELRGAALHVELVAAGLGLALVPTHVLRVHPARPAVRVVHLPDSSFQATVWFAVAPAAPVLKPAVDLVYDSVAQVLDGHSGTQPSPAPSA